jgi:hypothetical protein
MTKPPIARTPIPDIAGLPEDIRARILTVQEKSGIAPQNSAPSWPITIR